jgi:glycosyltransferase involved in cell wall biosynthesis
LSGDHLRPDRKLDLPSKWNWKTDKYLVYAANVSPHKNHELLFDALAEWEEHYPLILTGEGADLRSTKRGAYLRKYAESRSLKIQKSVIPLGYVPSEIYDSLLENAWALVMCSLAEGGGSFPVWEAMLRGIPVICADIPVMKEHVDRTGGDVIWFDPYDPSNLAKKLKYLKENYQSLKVTAEVQVSKLKHRSWNDVAEEYLEIFDAQVECQKKE